MKLDDERLGKYLDEIAAETIDIEKTIGQKDKKKNSLAQNPHILKSLKYSTIVIAEAIASTLQHILAKKYNVVILVPYTLSPWPITHYQLPINFSLSLPITHNQLPIT